MEIRIFSSRFALSDQTSKGLKPGRANDTVSVVCDPYLRHVKKVMGAEKVSVQICQSCVQASLSLTT